MDSCTKVKMYQGPDKRWNTGTFIGEMAGNPRIKRQKQQRRFYLQTSSLQYSKVNQRQSWEQWLLCWHPVEESVTSVPLRILQVNGITMFPLKNFHSDVKYFILESFYLIIFAPCKRLGYKVTSWLNKKVVTKS